MPANPQAARRRSTALSLALCLATAAHAQFDAHLGRIVGTVEDPDGALISDATIVAESIGSGQSRTVRSDELGRYQIGTLRPGEYRVTGSSPGLAPATVADVLVQVGSAVRADIRLQLEATHTSIEVASTLVDAMLPSSSNIVGNRTFNDLPINGRRFHDFALLTPTVQVSPTSGQLSFGAQRGIYTNVMVDGTDYNQSFFGGIQGGERASSIVTVPQSAIQEFQAVTSGFTAEYGRTTAGVVSVSTKSGSNELHGDAFYQIRHPELGVNDPFGARVLETLQQFGGSAGGPLRRNKAFWFLAFERQRADTPRYVEFPLLDTADRERGPEAYDHFLSLEEPFEATNDGWALTPRLDFQLGPRNQLMLRYNYSRSEALNSIGFGNATLPRTTEAVSANGTEEDSIHFLTGQWTGLLGPSVVNQLRVTVTREQRPRTPNSLSPRVGTEIGSFGTSSFLPTVETDTRPLVHNSLIVTSGSHSFKFGIEADHVGIEDVFGFSQFGEFILFGSDPNELLDALTPGGRIANRFDVPGIYLRQIGNTIGIQDLAHLALYVQDSWRVGSEWTIDLGFRWAGQFNDAPQLGNDLLIDRVRAADFPFGKVDPAIIPNDTGQAMPRLGFAYSPRGQGDRLVVRGSFGVFHAVTPPVFINAASKAFRDPPFDLAVALPTPAYPTVYQQFLAAGIDLNAYSLADLPVFPVETVTRALDGDPYAGAAPHLVSPDFRNPRSLKYTLGIERALSRRMVAGFQWMHHQTSRLHSLRDYNLPRAHVRENDPLAIPYYDTRDRPAPLVGGTRVMESLGRARYTGFTADWKYLGDRVQLISHYTYARSHSSDLNEGYFWDPLYSDQAVPEAAYGPSNLDMRHQLTAHGLFRLPGGFTCSAIVRAASAPPLDALAGQDLNGDLFPTERALAAPGRFVGRNAYRDRAMTNVDLRILKGFALSERIRAELSAELFNAFDIDNVQFGSFNRIYGPGLDPATGDPANPYPSFRRLRNGDGSYDRNNIQFGGTGPLRMQVGLRLRF